MKVVMTMSKLLKKIGRVIFRFFEAIFKVIDKIIIMPISRLVYNISKSINGTSALNTLLGKPHFLIVISLVFAIICFVFIDNKVINLVENEAEIIKDVPVKLVYNEEAFVVENVPETVDITITGNKSNIYLAKQLGNFEATVDLSKYTEAGTYKVKLTSTEAVNSVEYILNPGYLTVNIKDRVSEVYTVTSDIVSTDKLDKKLSVDNVTLDTTEVVVKGSQDTLDKISSIKALVSVDDDSYTEAGSYEVTNIPLVAYDKNGKIINNLDIVPQTLTGTLVLKSFKMTVPLQIKTTGSLVSGKAIATLTINNSEKFTVDIYGEESEIKNITSVPVYIPLDGLGNESVKNYTVTLSKPAGVRHMSVKNVNITATFGDEEQRTITINDYKPRNLAEGYNANIVSSRNTQVQVKGVLSNINKITANDINAYIDLAGLGEGTRDVEVKIDNNNPLINYVATNTITVNITK